MVVLLVSGCSKAEDEWPGEVQSDRQVVPDGYDDIEMILSRFDRAEKVSAATAMQVEDFLLANELRPVTTVSAVRRTTTGEILVKAEFKPKTPSASGWFFVLEQAEGSFVIARFYNLYIV